MWIEYENTSLSPFANHYEDGVDDDHVVYCFERVEQKDHAMIYHNTFEPIGSPYYWGAVYWSKNAYDGDCDGDLEKLKARVETNVTL
jgi:hypothetical protein